MAHLLSTSRLTRRGTLLSLAIAVLLAAFPAGLVGQGDDGEFERKRQRWESMSQEERAVMRKRFEEMRRLDPEERRELHERARNLRHFENGLRKAPPKDLHDRLQRHRHEHDREKEVRRYLHENSRDFGSRILDKLPPELRARVESTSDPKERRRLLDSYFKDCRRERGSRTERAIRMLDLPPAEKTRLLALPQEEREAKVLELKRRWIMQRVEEHGPPPGIDAEEWKRMELLSDREFFNRLRCVPKMPDHMRGREFWGRGRGTRGRDGDRRGGDRRDGDRRGDRDSRGERWRDGEDGRRRGPDGPPPPPRGGEGRNVGGRGGRY